MQKQLFSKSNITYFDVNLDDEFPIYYFSYTQKHKDLKELHYHNCYEIGLCVEGSGLFFIDNEVISFKKGDISIISPNQPHIAQSPNEIPSQWYFIMLDIDRLLFETNTYINNHQLPYIITTENNTDLSELLKLIINELINKEKNYKQVIKSMIYSFILKVQRLNNNAENISITLSNDFVSISPALNYISSFYTDNISVETLAKECHLSTTHFRVIFKKVTNQSPLQYLSNVRMKMAKSLLKSTKMPIITISQNVGYQNISSFNRTFKKQFGITPTEYRMH